MSCLSGIIGLKCSATGADSGMRFYLSELPGISLAAATQIADHEQGTGEAMLRESISFAEKMVALDFAQLLRAKNLVIREVISTTVAGNHSTVFQGVVAGTRGVFVGMSDPDDAYLLGHLNYLELNVQSPVASKNIDIYLDGQFVETITVNLVAGINKIILDYYFRINAVIEMDMTGVILSDGKTDFNNLSCSCIDECGPCLYFKGYANGVQTGTDLLGFVVSASCGGSIDAIVCAFRESLASAILYRAGGHVMESLMASPRPNPYVRNSKQEAQILYARWMGGTDPRTGFEEKGEYPRLLRQAVEASFSSILNNRSRAFGETNIRAISTVNPLYHPRRKLREKSFQRTLKNYW